MRSRSTCTPRWRASRSPSASRSSLGAHAIAVTRPSAATGATTPTFVPGGRGHAAEVPERDAPQLGVVAEVGDQADQRAREGVDGDAGQHEGDDLGAAALARRAVHEQHGDQPAGERERRDRPASRGSARRGRSGARRRARRRTTRPPARARPAGSRSCPAWPRRRSPSEPPTSIARSTRGNRISQSTWSPMRVGRVAAEHAEVPAQARRGPRPGARGRRRCPPRGRAARPRPTRSTGNSTPGANRRSDMPTPTSARRRRSPVELVDHPAGAPRACGSRSCRAARPRR